MIVDTGAVAVTPRWLGMLWVWLPAVGALLLFGGAAVLESASGPVAWWWAGAAVGSAAAYAGRERWPVAGLVLTLLVVVSARLPGVGVLDSGFDVIYLLLLLVPVLSLVGVASRFSPGWSWLALAATVVVTVAVSPDPPWSGSTFSAQATVVRYVLDVGVPAMIAVAGWLAGYVLLARQRYADALLERAVWLERTHDAEAMRAVGEERTRIAQELHDVVTHSVAVMVVQASAAAAMWERDPKQARASLEAVEESGRTVMADLRGMLRAMRTEGTTPAEWQAQPGLDDLSGLVDQITMTGISAQLTTSGVVSRVSPLTALSLLRIAQESVTNAMRHARATTISIGLAVGEETVQLSVADDGVGLEATEHQADALDPHRHGGHGLVGMRERANAIGGTLDVVPGVTTGTIVTIRAPLRQDALV